MAGHGSDATPPLTPRLRALDRAFLAVVGVFGVVTAATLLLPAQQVRFVAPDLDLVLDTLSTVVTASVAALAWARFSDSRESSALLQAAAFLVLAIANGFALVAAAAAITAEAGMTLGAPTQAPIYIYTLARLLAAALLVSGGLASLGRFVARRPRSILVSAGAALLAVIVVTEVLASALPPLDSPSQMPNAAAVSPALPTSTLLGAGAQVLAAGLFLWAAAESRRIFRRDRSVGDAYVAIGLVFAAFAQCEMALAPGVYSGLVTLADLFRLGFDLMLLLGIQAAAGETLRHLRRANEDLAELRVRDVERAALEERARLARELHDGLAQNLWLAKLTTHRIASLPNQDLEAESLLEELDATLDAGLSDAHEAVAALRLAGSPQGDLSDLLRRLVTEFDDRFGARVRFDSDDVVPSLPARTQAETLRIVHEALANARRHADASLVRVSAAVEDGQLEVTVRDNGCGFDTETVGEGSFGLASMRERAELVGGELRIDSGPQDGTSVRLLIPITEMRAVAAAESA